MVMSILEKVTLIRNIIFAGFDNSDRYSGQNVMMRLGEVESITATSYIASVLVDMGMYDCGYILHLNDRYICWIELTVPVFPFYFPYL